jgi:hypothetical protein
MFSREGYIIFLDIIVPGQRIFDPFIDMWSRGPEEN